MATAQTIINRALRLCKVLDAASAASADDTADALETLNAMLAEWHEAEIGLPDYALADNTTELASDAGDREAIAYQLAIRIAPEYGANLAVEVLGMAEATMGRLRLRYFQPGTVTTGLPSTRARYDVDAG